MRSVHTQTKGTDRPECFVPRPGGYLALGLGLVLGLFGMTRQAALAEEPSQPREGSPEVTFESDILPLLTRFGCNTGPCHGKSRGQNGFALSLFGFDADFDYAAIVLESRGRRVQFTAPEHSLLLRKAIGAEPHGGGSRFSGESPYYEMIRKWIEAGAPRTPRDAAQLLNVRLEPDRQSLTPQQAVPLRVLAEYSDGVVRDVTDGAAFDSNDKSVATISSNGVVQAGELPGETAVMARYMNHIAVCAVTIPLPGNVPPEKYAELPRNNEIDDFVWEKLKLLGMLPSPPASEATLHRRTYLRLIGRLPTADETRAYLADTSPDKRERMVDQLLARPEYADFWANKWADLLRPNPFRVGMKGVYTLDSWLRAAFRENKPYDEFVRELVTAQGSTWRTADDLCRGGAVPMGQPQGLGRGLCRRFGLPFGARALARGAAPGLCLLGHQFRRVPVLDLDRRVFDLSIDHAGGMARVYARDGCRPGCIFCHAVPVGMCRQAGTDPRTTCRVPVL